MATVTGKVRVRKLPDVVIALHYTHIHRSIAMVQLIVSIAVMLTRYVSGNAPGIAWSRTFYSLPIVNLSASVAPAVNSSTARRTVLVRHLMLLWPLGLRLSLPVRRELLLLPLTLLGRVVLFNFDQ
ncbi:hypothetical protein E2C01_068609 [Portunus trituberculatus]|uniref:Uncharacterized protein n=1 Tax=Portunus trituberculatus TaxID=210409 RepID=A0A5B7HWM1_PORTR|nr:hypothetical protein [Portunus trituberculatus]